MTLKTIGVREPVSPSLSRPGEDCIRWQLANLEALDFQLPADLEAGGPPEARGLERDQVRLMVSYRTEDRIVHTHFRRIVDFLRPGDALVINTSGTLNAALRVQRDDGTPLEMHLSTHLPGDLWSVELRRTEPGSNEPFYTAKAGETLSLPGGAQARLLVPYRPEQRQAGFKAGGVRLWIATLALPLGLEAYLDRHGFPIHYKYVRDDWPPEYYQTAYATEKGSAEMPSAGRPFTPELITQLVARGILVLPLLLHTGVASLEKGERPYEEYYRVPATTAQAVNQVRAAGGHVMAVGTTVLRALETVVDEDGTVHSGEGWTSLVITPEHALRSADGMLTGLHEPRSSHLAMLLALAGLEHVKMAYTEALQNGYLWHEFGDLHLILP